ncbi:DUF475 domain-containing protein [Frankia sp. AgKG'84/4]|uniref:DUF475 domain-containing protein n=1 Tax=Frankia sp. AgKG'84/4 TaxID=573490 RepID=UPI00200E1D1C|nr:DUF475 domain-containing protein [Frankia sp. AgKG'84/4]MCL9794125.1 DUF475 domain-containing protein [Frankia sp. AgKG'84/4]
MHALRIFGWSLAITVLGVAAAGVIGGPRDAALVAILAVLEISLSFDNAVINATILRRMSAFWQKLFLTVGVLIAVFGMRLLFPIVIVALTAHLSPADVFDLALNDGAAYGEKLNAAHPAIAAFGGIFLFMLFLDFLFDPERDVQWIKKLEEPLRRAGQLDVIPIVVALVALLVVGEAFSGDHTQQVLTSGVAGLATYLAVRGLGEFFESRGVGEEAGDDDEAEEVAAAGAVGRTGTTGTPKLVLATGKAAAFLFLYLEVIDASFSFDGVVGAFAISQNIFIIAAGLGIGAMYIRSLTVYLVRRGTLSEYIYLEHGAHYAIGALAIILAVSIETEVPEIVTGLVGVAFIGLALISSILHRRRGAADEGPAPAGDGDDADRQPVGAPL